MYINTSTMQYPIGEIELRSMFPGEVFPSPFVPPSGFERVIGVPVPTCTVTQTVREGAPAQNENGDWLQNWIVEDITDPVKVSQILAAYKARLKKAVKAKRDLLETQGFAYMGKILDSDIRSVQRINTSVQAAQAALAAGAPFSVDWVCADDSALTLDAVAMAGVPVALAMRASAIHQHARSLKELIDAAQSAEDLDAINPSTDWPALT